MEKSLSVKAFAVAIGIVWAACIFLVGLINLLVPSFGLTFLWFVSSVSPGFNADPNLLSVLIGSAYGLLEGFLVGGLIALVYNLLSKRLK